MDITELKSSVLAICKKLPEHALVTGTTGNVSARDPESGYVAIKPSGYAYGDMDLDDIIVLSADGDFIENNNNRKPSFETPTHLEIYRRAGHVNGVIHSHSKFVNILACVKDEIPCATTPTGLRLLKKAIPVIPFVDNGTQKMADIIAPLLVDNTAIAIRNHGPFIAGESLQLAFERAIALEDTSQIYFQASLLGVPSLIGQ